MRLVLAVIPTLLACTDSDPADELVPPTTPDEVAAIYDGLDTCHDSTVIRGFAPRTELSVTSLWLAPDDAPAGLVRLRAADGTWPPVLAVTELSGEGIGGSVTARSPDDPCLAVDRLFSPHRPAGSERSEYLHALLYLGEGAHPYSAFPAGGIEARRADAPLALESYLNAVSAIREPTSDGGSVFRDAVAQQLPMYVACDRPLQIETTTAIISGPQLATVDASLCDAGTDGRYRCVGERAVNVAGTTCTFVVDGRSLVTDGVTHPVAFGGTITTTGTGAELAYSLRIDRFSSVR